MPVNADWLNDEKTILRFVYAGHWTWDEAVAMLDDANRKMKQVKHPVAVIVDMTDGQRLPENPLENIGRLAQGRGKSPNDSGITVFLNADVLTKAMQDVIEITGASMPQGLTATYARTLDEAIEKAKAELARYNDTHN